MIPNLVIRTITLFGGICVSRAVNKVLPVNTAMFKDDPIGTIGTTIVQAAVSDAVMTYIENRIVETLDSIAIDQYAEAPVIIEPPKPTKVAANHKPRSTAVKR